MNEKVASFEKRGSRSSRGNGITRSGTDIYNTRVATDSTREDEIEWGNEVDMRQHAQKTIDHDAKRTGINRKFDSILLGISSAVCFGLLAGVVVGLWAIPIGIIAGFYIAYKTNQQEQY